jgi:hypothetical protein
LNLIDLLQALRMAAAAQISALPISFAPIEDDKNPEMKFVSRGSNYSLFLNSREALLYLSPSRTRRASRFDLGVLAQTQPALLHMRFENANTSSEIIGIDTLPGHNNYLVGSDATKWRTNVPTYRKVRYRLEPQTSTVSR